MDPEKKPYKEPAHETGSEQTKRQLMEIEVQAGLSDERDVLDEIAQQTFEADKTLSDIQQRTQNIESDEA